MKNAQTIGVNEMVRVEIYDKNEKRLWKALVLVLKILRALTRKRGETVGSNGS